MILLTSYKMNDSNLRQRNRKKGKGLGQVWNSTSLTFFLDKIIVILEIVTYLLFNEVLAYLLY